MVCCHPTRMESCRSCDRTVVYAWNKRSRFRLPWNWNKMKNFCLRAEANLLWGCDLPHLIHQGPFAFFYYVRCIVTPIQRMSIYDDVSYQYLSIFHACKQNVPCFIHVGPPLQKCPEVPCLILAVASGLSLGMRALMLRWQFATAWAKIC